MNEIDDRELSVVKGQASKALTAANELTIANDEDYSKATDVLSRIKKVGKMIKDRKEAITKPLNEAITSARGLFKPIEQNHEEAERIIKGKMIGYQNEQERIRREAMEKIEKKVETGKMKEETAIKKIDELPEVKKTVEGKVGQTTTREIPKYRILVEDEVPREFCSPDMAKIKKALDSGVAVPGAEKYYEKVISAR